MICIQSNFVFICCSNRITENLGSQIYSTLSGSSQISRLMSGKIQFRLDSEKMALGTYLIPSESVMCTKFGVDSSICFPFRVRAHTHTHTHNRFTALLEYVRDHPGEQVPER